MHAMQLQAIGEGRGPRQSYGVSLRFGIEAMSGGATTQESAIVINLLPEGSYFYDKQVFNLFGL